MSTGVSFIDSALVRVCVSKRISSNEVFKGIAATRWIRIVIDDKEEILNFTITQANVDDRSSLKEKRFLDKISKILYADKEYIGKDLMQLLFTDGLHLITHIKQYEELFNDNE